MNSIILKSLKDYFSKKILFLSFAPLFIPMVIFGLIFIFGGNSLIDLLSQGAQSGDFSFLDESAHPFLAYILGFAVVKWLIVTLFYLFGFAFVVAVSIVIAVIVVGFLTPKIVKIVRDRHYGDIELSSDMGMFESMGALLGIFGKFILIFLVSLPFLLIPVLNFITFYIPFFYLFYKLMILDILSSGITSKERGKEIVKKHRVNLILSLGVCFALSLIPFAGLFLQPLFVIYLAHFFFTKSYTNI